MATAAQLGDGKGRQVFASRNLMRMAVCGCVTLTCLAAAGASDTKDPQKAAAKQAQLDATPGAVEPRVAASGKSDKYDLDRIGARGVGGGLNMYSLQRERELGAAMAATLDRNTKFCPDPDVYDYVNQLAQKIARYSDAQVPFTIRVIDSPDMNIFSLPGGYLYVNKGLITQLDSEAELAGLMAHEIAHVAARHGTRLATRKNAWSMVGTPLSYAAGPAAPAMQLVPLTFKKFSRDAEFEADLLGLEYQNAAGYDPQAFLDALEKWNTRQKALQKRKLKAVPMLGWFAKFPGHEQIAGSFSNYPKLEDRIAKAQGEMAKVLPTRDDYVMNTSEFEDVKAKLEWADRPILRRHPGGGGGNTPVLIRHPTAESQAEGSEIGKLFALSH